MAEQPGGAKAAGRQLLKPIQQSQLFNTLMSALAEGTHQPSGAPEFIRRTSEPGITPPPHLRILVAEDHHINRRLAMLMLEKLGYRADFVSDGAEAVRKWQQIPFDVILMDCEMPVQDGFATTREIRRREAQQAAGRHVHIIAMTANTMKGDREKCLDAGMDDYVSKPMRFDALQSALARVRESEPSALAIKPTHAGNPMNGRSCARQSPDWDANMAASPPRS